MSSKIIENEAAIRYFNMEAEKLLGLLTEMKAEERTGHTIKSLEQEPGISIDESEISYLFQTRLDREGNEISRYFYVASDKWIGIDPVHYKDVRKFYENILKNREINEKICVDSLVKIIFDWMKSIYIKSSDKSHQFVDYLNDAIQELIKEVTISIPITNMVIDMEFDIGRVKFEYLKKELFDRIEIKLAEKVGTKEMSVAEITENITKLRKDYQGKVVGTVKVLAEVNKAVELAEKEIDRAIMALMYYSPNAFFPKIAALIGRKGTTWISSKDVLIFNNDIPDFHQAVIGYQQLYKIDGALLNKLKQSGLDKLSSLLLKNNPTEFEELLFTALYTFTKAVAQISYHEKIVFILSALEIIFLKDSGEPIQIHVGQRLGFLNSPDPDRRKEAVSLVSQAYKIRSNYIHHGQEDEDYEILLRLQHACWNAINKMLTHHDKFGNKQEFLDYIEKLIYS